MLHKPMIRFSDAAIFGLLAVTNAVTLFAAACAILL